MMSKVSAVVFAAVCMPVSVIARAFVGVQAREGALGTLRARPPLVLQHLENPLTRCASQRAESGPKSPWHAGRLQEARRR